MSEEKIVATQDTIIAAMVASNGDRLMACAALGITNEELSAYFALYPDLRSLYVKAPETPNAQPDGIAGAMVRKDPRNLPPAREFLEEAKDFAANIKGTDAMFYNAGALKNIGLKPKTVERLMSMGEFDQFAGRHMYCALEMSQRILSLTLPSLFEMAEEYKDQYLTIKPGDPKVLGEDLRDAHKVYLEIMRTFLAYHKTLFGAAAVMAQIGSNKGKGASAGPPKPGKLKFTPLIDGQVTDLPEHKT